MQRHVGEIVEMFKIEKDLNLLNKSKNAKLKIMFESNKT